MPPVPIAPPEPPEAVPPPEPVEPPEDDEPPDALEPPDELEPPLAEEPPDALAPPDELDPPLADDPPDEVEPPLPVEPPDDAEPPEADDPPEEEEPPLDESPPEPDTVAGLGAQPVWAKENNVARQVPTRISLGLVMGAPSKVRLGLDMVIGTGSPTISDGALVKNIECSRVGGPRPWYVAPFPIFRQPFAVVGRPRGRRPDRRTPVGPLM